MIKIQLPKQYCKSWGPPPPISYKADATLDKTPTDKSNSLKVDIKTQLGYTDIKTVEIYVLLFWAGITEALIKLVTILNTIIRGQDLSTGSQKFGKKSNLVIG